MADSFVRGATEPPLLEITIGQAFDRACASWPTQEALVCPAQSVRLTWAALQARVNDVSAGLLSSGLYPGDRIGIWSFNRVEWTITQFAAAKAGLILVTVNPAYRLSELEYALNKVACKALVISPPFKSSDYPGMIMALAPELAEATPGELQAKRLPHKPCQVHDHLTRWKWRGVRLGTRRLTLPALNWRQMMLLISSSRQVPPAPRKV
ncbi:MAG: AMP-binding protein [Acidocella sp.]|nr:AMP-binding protein [Acidocella sp.]